MESQAPVTSREKVERYLRGLADSAPEGDMMASAAMTFLPQILSRLPRDPRQLDSLLLRYAALLLHMRSDDAPTATLNLPDEEHELAAAIAEASA